MKRSFFLAAATALARLCLIANASAADNKPLPTVSVAPTKPKANIAYWQPAMGEGLAQMMVTKLSELPNMRVLETLHLDDLRSERQLGESGEVSEGESVKKGTWKGADYTFVTELTRFGSKENTYGGGGWVPGLPLVGHVSIKKSQNDVLLVWRIIDNATREIVPGASG